MSKNSQIDILDKVILKLLRKDSWMPFVEVTKEFGASGLNSSIGSENDTEWHYCRGGIHL